MKMIIKKNERLEDRDYAGSLDWHRIVNKSLIVDLSTDVPKIFDPRAAEYAHLYDTNKISKKTASRDGLVEILGIRHTAAIEELMIRKIGGEEVDLFLQCTNAKTQQASAVKGIGLGNSELSFNIFVLNQEGRLELYGLSLSVVVVGTQYGDICVKKGQVSEVEGDVSVDKNAFCDFLLKKGPVRLDRWLKKCMEGGCYAQDWGQFDSWVHGDQEIILMGMHHVIGIEQSIMLEVKPALVPMFKTYDSPRIFRKVKLMDDAFENGSEDWSRSRANMSIIVTDMNGGRSYVDIMSSEFDMMFKDSSKTPSATRDGLALLLGTEYLETIRRTMTRYKNGVDCDLQLQAIGGDALEMGVEFGFESVIPMDNYYYVFEIDAEERLRVHALMLAPAIIGSDGGYKVVETKGPVGKISGFVGQIPSKDLRCFIESKSPVECVDWLDRSCTEGFIASDWECFKTLSPSRFPALLASVSQVAPFAEGVDSRVMAELNPKVVKCGLTSIVSAPEEGGSFFQAMASVTASAMNGACAVHREMASLSMFARRFGSDCQNGLFATPLEIGGPLDTESKDGFEVVILKPDTAGR